MIKSWTDEAWEEFEYWAKNDKKVFKRILELIKDIDRNGLYRNWQTGSSEI